MVNEEATSQVSPDNCGGSAATIPSATSGVQQTATTAAPRDQFLEAWRRLDVTAAEHPRFARTLAQGLDVVRRALDEFDGSDPKAGEGGGELAISFNGGKDACVVLYLLLLVLAERDQLDRLSASRMTNDKARHVSKMVDERLCHRVCKEDVVVCRIRWSSYRMTVLDTYSNRRRNFYTVVRIAAAGRLWTLFLARPPRSKRQVPFLLRSKLDAFHSH